MYVWNGLFKREILPFFEAGRRIGQDQDFTIHTLLQAKLIAKGYGVKQSYRIRLGGSKSLNLEERAKFQYLALDDIKKHILNAGGDADLVDAYYERCFRADLGLMDRYSTRKKKNKPFFKQIRNKLRNEILPVLKSDVNRRSSLHLKELAETAFEADEFIRGLAEKAVDENVSFTGDSIIIPHGFVKDRERIFRIYVIIEGLKMSDAINIFISQVELRDDLPFMVNQKRNAKNYSLFLVETSHSDDVFANQLCSTINLNRTY